MTSTAPPMPVKRSIPVPPTKPKSLTASPIAGNASSANSATPLSTPPPASAKPQPTSANSSQQLSSPSPAATGSPSALSSPYSGKTSHVLPPKPSTLANTRSPSPKLVASPNSASPATSAPPSASPTSSSSSLGTASPAAQHSGEMKVTVVTKPAPPIVPSKSGQNLAPTTAKPEESAANTVQPSNTSNTEVKVTPVAKPMVPSKSGQNLAPTSVKPEESAANTVQPSNTSNTEVKVTSVAKPMVPSKSGQNLASTSAKPEESSANNVQQLTAASVGEMKVTVVAKPAPPMVPSKSGQNLVSTSAKPDDYVEPSQRQLNALAEEFSVSNSELDALKMLFLEMDVDNDGVISISDLLRYKFASRRVVALVEEEEEESVPYVVEPPSNVIQLENLFTKTGMAKSESERVITFAGADDSAESVDETHDEISDLLKDMDLSSSSDEEEEQAAKVEDSSALQDAPKKGFSFRHIDFASLPQPTGESSDDDDLLKDWDGDSGEGDGKLDADGKPTLNKTKSKMAFGSLKKAISKRLR